jgi:hypothetical protein
LQTIIWFLAAGALVVAMLAIGLAVAAVLHREGMSPGEDLMVGFGGGIAVLALAAVAQLPLPIAYTTASPPLMILLLVASAAVLWRRREWLRGLAADPQVRVMAVSVGALFAVGLAVGALPWDRPSVGSAGTVGSFHVPNMPGDTLLEYRTAQILQNRLPIETTDYYVNYWYISDRTPLTGFVTTFVTSAVGIKLPPSLDALSAPYQVIDPFGYWLYRQLSMLTNAMVLASALLVAWELFGPRVAKLGAVFTILSPYVLINILFHWPKLLAGFFIVGFYFWTYMRRRPIFAGIFAAGAVLSHPGAALFLPGMFLYMLLTRRWRQLVTTALAAAVTAFPWFFWTSVIYHHTSRMITYPIGFALANPTNPGPEIRADLEIFIHRPLLGILNDRWVSVRNTFTAWPFPYELITTRSIKNAATTIYEIFRTTFPGIFGAGLALFGYATIKRIVLQPFWAATLGASTICFFLFWGFQSRAVGQEAFQPVAALWICLAAAILVSLPAWVIRAAIIVNLVEWVGFTYVLLDKTPPLGAWHVSWALLFVLSLLLVGATSLLGWKISIPVEPDESDDQSGRARDHRLRASASARLG